MRKVFFIAVLSIVSNSAFSAFLKCQDVKEKISVEFTDQVGSFANYQGFIIEADGEIDQYFVKNSQEYVGAHGGEGYYSTYFLNDSREVANLKYRFFTRPEDRNRTGWSSRNGAKMELLIMGKLIELDCVKSDN